METISIKVLLNRSEEDEFLENLPYGIRIEEWRVRSSKYIIRNIHADTDTLLFLKLKYGAQNVWIL